MNTAIYCSTVWLIDDDELSNCLNANTLQTKSFSADVQVFTSAEEALVELDLSVKKKTFPDFIFLDLNMPVVNGWDFLNTYRNFPEAMKEKCTLYILSSSIDEDDINRSKLYEDVRDFFSKPLKKKDLEIVKFQAG